MFPKIDLKNGYHQLLLSKSSRNLTTFSTHEGLFRFCSANFGINSIAEILHNEISKVIQHVNGAFNIHDDIFIFGRTQEEHDHAVEEVLLAFFEAGLTVNKAKCEFNKKLIVFFGLVFSAEGVKPDPAIVEALKHAEPPTSKSELKSFLGMVNFSADFIKHYAHLTANYET